eukprot:c6675_g1_i1 orf=482-2788(-)
MAACLFPQVQFLCLFFLLHLLSWRECRGFAWTGNTKQVYVVYLGSKIHDDPEITSLHNHHLLARVHDGRLDAAAESIVYSYKHSFRGFSARLSPDQVASLAEMPDVLRIFRSERRQLHTTRSWEFLGFQPTEVGGIPHSTGRQHNVILGILDTGLWPESKSFSDHLMPPVPRRWRGRCDPGENFTIAMCNRKVIGARYYMKGLQGGLGDIPSISAGGSDFLSPRDSEGHGSHTASTAAGRFVANMNMQGLANGGARGGAPLARIAVYKVCWSEGCFDADILAAFDDAIKDGVDILSLSLGPDPPQNDYFNDAVSIGSFHAVRQGISVICSVGNNGPAKTATNIAPWILTVAASSIDRTFPSNVVLGSKAVLQGVSLSRHQMNVGSAQLIYGGNANMPLFTPTQSSYCLNSSLDPTKVKGQIVVCQHPGDYADSRLAKSQVVKAVGGVGMVLIDESDQDIAIPFDLPATLVGSEAGKDILSYINSSRRPTAYITPASTVLDYKPAPQVAVFSARGPNPITADILKPDITAPGLNILAAWSPAKQGLDFNIVSGTSMSCPHVSGIAVLLKASHPTWSPAAIKSAIMTTAYVRDNEGNSVTCSPTGIAAGPFDFGAGHVFPRKAQNPGLIYDAEPGDYVDFLCGSGYDTSTLQLVTGDKTTLCPLNSSHPSNLNYPSITISTLEGKQTVVRRATNVGNSDSVYHADLNVPMGVTVRVIPDTLVFTSFGQTLSFSLEFTVVSPGKDYVFGSLTWINGLHKVRSPIVVNPRPS